MGNQNAKTGAQSRFSESEVKGLEVAFRTACGGGHTDKLQKEKLLESWSSLIDLYLAQRTASYLYSSNTVIAEETPRSSRSSQHRLTSIPLIRFAEPLHVVLRGTIEEKTLFLAASLDKTDTNQFSVKELENYVAAVLKSYLKILSAQKPQNAAYDSWIQHGYQSSERSILGFAKGLTRSLSKSDHDEHHFYLEQLERWMQINATFLIIWAEVFTHLYSKTSSKMTLTSESNDSVQNLLPVLDGLGTCNNYAPILDVPHVIFINSNLPSVHRHKWRFLFSSTAMGESFSTMLGKIQNRGPTLLIVEDEDRYIFGGYAPEAWALRPNFVGDNSSLLLTLSPAMRCFESTGYNDHYQYLNLNQQTMPNGLGMGGQFNYWGMWLDSEYGLGQSCETCSTYRDYVQLSKRKEFRIRNLEVWGIGDEPKLTGDSDDEDDKTKPSVLDKNLEDRVMLELSGREMHSDGLREPVDL